MNFNEYQKLSYTTATYPNQHTAEGLAYTTLGLNGEANELAEKIDNMLQLSGSLIRKAGQLSEFVKKVLRDNGGIIPPEKLVLLRKEGGDVLWYLAAMFTEVDVTLDDIAQENLDKLFDRRARGVLSGSGDER